MLLKSVVGGWGRILPLHRVGSWRILSLANEAAGLVRFNLQLSYTINHIPLMIELNSENSLTVFILGGTNRIES